MFAFTDPEDHALMLTDMTQQRDELRREYHMTKIKKLSHRLCGLRMLVVQRNIIRHLKLKINDLQKDGQNIFSSQNAYRDRSSKDYMIFLLEGNDFYNQEIAKLEQKLKALDNEERDVHKKKKGLIKTLVKQARRKAELASREKAISTHENRMESALQEIGKLSFKNHHLRESIGHMFVVRRSFFVAYQDLLRLKKRDQKIVSDHLEKAVSAYRNREDFRFKTELLEERLYQDKQKIEANNILLHRTKERDSKMEEFELLKVQERSDCRAPQIEELVRKGMTGLEPLVESARTKHDNIMFSSGSTSEEEVRKKFEVTDIEIFNDFCYIRTLQIEIEMLEVQIKELNSQISELTGELSHEQRMFRRVIEEREREREIVEAEVAAAESKRNEAEAQLVEATEIVQRLADSVLKATKHVPDDTKGHQMEDWLVTIETALSDHLIIVEFLRYENVEVIEQEKPQQIDSEYNEEENFKDGSPDDEDELAEKAPRSLEGNQKQDIPSEEANDFLSADELREIAMKSFQSDA